MPEGIYVALRTLPSDLIICKKLCNAKTPLKGGVFCWHSFGSANRQNERAGDFPPSLNPMRATNSPMAMVVPVTMMPMTVMPTMVVPTMVPVAMVPMVMPVPVMVPANFYRLDVIDLVLRYERGLHADRRRSFQFSRYWR